jgi:hypothetical protein
VKNSPARYGAWLSSGDTIRSRWPPIRRPRRSISICCRWDVYSIGPMGTYRYLDIGDIIEQCFKISTLTAKLA